MLVSQFTLLGDTTTARRPEFDRAAPTEEALRLYEKAVSHLRAGGLIVETGIVAAHMQVELLNDGRVTFLLDSRRGS